MEKEMSFHILGIEETKDETRRENGLHAPFSETNPEDDPEGFKRLRTAYETAAAFAGGAGGGRNPEQETRRRKKTELDEWIDRVDACYRDVYGRTDERKWRQLLEDPVCDGLDTSLGGQRSGFWSI